MRLDKYDTIILDCDGVILDSNYLKIDAFRSALREFDEEIVKSFVEYFKNNFGTSRYHLTKVFIEEFLKKDFDEELYNKILDDFGKHCVIEYNKADFTSSFLEFVKNYSDKKLFVASGSAQGELRDVFRSKEIDNYFIDIFGSPVKKSEIVKNIVEGEKNSVMIGDALSDMEAAEESNIDFIFMRDYSTNETMKKDDTIVSVNNLGDLI